MSDVSLQANVSGMSCSACALSIEKSLKLIPGVKTASVNFATSNAKLELTPESNQESIKIEAAGAIKKLGYSLLFNTESSAKNVAEPAPSINNFIITMGLSLAVFAFAMWPLMDWPTRQGNYLIQLFLSLPVWLFFGRTYILSVFQFIRSGQANMNTLIGVGTSAAFIYSAAISIFYQSALDIGLQDIVYFEAACFIIAFVSLGQHLETLAKKNAKKSLAALYQLSSKSALRIRNEVAELIDIDEVAVGDIIRVKPGEKIPCDGLIVRGQSHIEEAMISGEPIPVFRDKGDSVFAGSINGEGNLDIKASKTSRENFLAQLTAFIVDAQNNKAPIQRLADRVSKIFVPSILIISLMTFALWMLFGPSPGLGLALSNTIAVLVIACPCAVGLATPMAIFVATSSAALRGILISGGITLEKADKITTCVFDKTGTLTLGQPKVLEVLTAANIPDFKLILSDVASLESFSEHPLSKAIINYSQANNVTINEPDKFTNIPGRGIVGSVRGTNYLIGNSQLLKDNSVEVINFDYENKFADMPASLVHIAAKNGEKHVHLMSALIGDLLKEDASTTIKNLKEMGIKPILLTGDQAKAANYIANKTGITEFYSELSPHQKLEKIVEMQNRGESILMIGDGINDAPALAQANLSMAMASGSQVAIENSDVTIVGHQIYKVVSFLKLSHKTMRIIKQNLFFSMGYNIALIPIAAGILYPFGGPLMPPVLASIAMGTSSISVILNSIRLRKK
ncbi:MAG: copper-translocating P-type ATPase [Oligoflexales bacterium]|nr:copper-translocating P-type ATPase [Oligoflexales bacterium]